MPNRHSGICYRCGKEVAAGEGVFEKTGRPQMKKWPNQFLPKWLLQHHECAIIHGGTSTHYQYNPLTK